MIEFVKPNITRDAPFAFSWFDRPDGRQTLLSMGNADNEILPPTMAAEVEILKSFIDMEAEGTQTTRMVCTDGKTIGAVWVEWTENHGVQPPSIHVMIGDPDYRGQGFGTKALKEAMRLVYVQKPGAIIYSRHLANNHTVAHILTGIGFTADGNEYTDINGLRWQNVMKV